jgi:gamma-glutamyl hydrolase
MLRLLYFLIPSLLVSSVKMSNKASMIKAKLNNRPMIGILTQPIPERLKSYPKVINKTSYVMQSYVTYLESAGARVVPLLYDESVNKTLDKLEKLNGVFFAGGISD